jgi:hypothetical protein
VKQPYGALLQRCAVFDAAGSDNGRLDHSIGVILQCMPGAGSDRLEKTFFTPGGIQMTDSRPLAHTNRLKQAMPNEAEAAACVGLPGIESSKQHHDPPR